MTTLQATIRQPRADWRMPERPTDKCEWDGCDGDMVATAYDDYGWHLYWACNKCGECPGLDPSNPIPTYIDWPFAEDESASYGDLEALGFYCP